MQSRNNTKKKLKLKRYAGVNYFSFRRKSKHSKSLKSKRKKKKKHIIRKIKTQQKLIKTQQELIKERQEFIKSVIKINKDYSVANQQSSSLLLEKLGNQDLVELIFTYNEKLNTELNTKLNKKLSKLRPLMQMIVEKYNEPEHKDLIEQINSIILTNKLDEKSNLIETILEEIKIIYENEEQRMEYKYQDDEIIEATEKILDEM